MSKLLAVVGPTGTGKSNLAIALAHELEAAGQPAEIVNTDSMQFYRGMNIGTAKLDEAEREGVVHHMIDILDITDESTAAEYQRIARPLIEDIQARGLVPILCGGSMLYVAAVLNTFEFPSHDDELRAELEADLEARGSVALHKDLAALDPSAASRIDPLNPRRVVRALEIVRLTGQPFAAALPEKTESWQPVMEIGLNSERAHLVDRLNRRVELMWQSGLVQEAESLIPLGIREGKTSSRAIGYAQALAQLDGQLTQDEAIA
ncbi:MAG: tRNA (adenosine(37)-N6)-dimethylallyltransferase MiaA, partial [Phenylobacterium zucineum]